MAKHLDKLIHLAGARGLVRARDLADRGIPRQYLNIACDRGLLERVDRGLYALPGALQTEHRGLVEVCARVPNGVICLLSALQYHGLTTQSPYEVWMAIGECCKVPKLSTVQLRIARFSKATLTAGVQTRLLDGAELRVFNPAKTVADCFKIPYSGPIRGINRLANSLDHLRELTRLTRLTRLAIAPMGSIRSRHKGEYHA